IQRFLRPVWAYDIGDAITGGALPFVKNWHRISATTPRRITVDAGREAQQNRADVELGIKTLEEHFAEQGMDFEDEMRVRAQNARRILDLAEEYKVPLEMLWRPTGGTNATPAVGENEEPPATGEVRQPG